MKVLEYDHAPDLHAYKNLAEARTDNYPANANMTATGTQQRLKANTTGIGSN